MSDPASPSAAPAIAAAPSAPKPPAEKNTDETVKETLESIVIAFVLAFVFRAYVVEAFVIPTGSMAPTLLGEHVRVTCRECGYRFTSDNDDLHREAVEVQGRRVVASRPYVVKRAPRDRQPEAVCPMCHAANVVPPGQRISAGDRILVHKYLYSLTEPRRWDVVVFKNPTRPGENYIKRLVGLPGEGVLLIDGNVYVRGPGETEADWRIARKTQRERVQRAVWQPVYHSDFIPLDGGDPNKLGRSDRPWRVPWFPADGGGAWELEGRRSYRHGGAGAGRIDFDFERQHDRTVAWYPYNQFKVTGVLAEPVEDVRVAAAFQPDRPGLAVTIQTTSRLDSGGSDPDASVLRARIDADGRATLEKLPAGGGEPESLGAPARVAPLAPGVATQVELWYVDQEASLWVDGKRVLVHAFDGLTLDEAVARNPPQAFYPAIAIGVEGSPVTLHRVEVDRDLYYSPRRYPLPDPPHLTPRGGREVCIGGPGTASLFKGGDERREGGPVNLEADQFFCLGDNSPLSHDGRAWVTLDPWVEERMLANNQQRVGVVPRRLMMGRAFFVYFPAPYSWRDDYMPIFPNFGDMRFIH